MKNLEPLFLVLMPCLFLFFTACQKENVKTVNSEVINETELIQARVNVCDVGWTYARDTPSTTCGDPDLTVCYIDFTPIELLDDNQTCGRINVNSDGDLEFTFDQFNLDQIVLRDMYTTGNFSVQRNIELPLDVISPLYVAAGFPPLEEPIVLQIGDYPVTFDGEIPEGPNYLAPYKIITTVSKTTGDILYFYIWV